MGMGKISVLLNQKILPSLFCSLAGQTGCTLLSLSAGRYLAVLMIRSVGGLY